ncbi:MAG: multiheme c-type cytochrome [Steroidobacteraceae bacterium]
MVREAAVGLALLAAGVRTGMATSPLPYQSQDRHLGVATCATSVCHGSVTPTSGHDVDLNEFVTWSHDDRHAQAYTALSGEKGRAIAARLGIADARLARECLGCHSDDVPSSRRGAGFAVTDGVGCEACHGGAERWLAMHSARGTLYRQDLARGMFPTADLHERASLCLSCHLGNEDKFATHRILGAGHPRLAFELDTFLALQPPHYHLDADYAKRKPVHSRTQTWVQGQLAAAVREMRLLQGPLLHRSGLMPELALLDCHACHENPLHRQRWNRSLLTRQLAAGSVPFPQGHLKMAMIIAGLLDGQAAGTLVRQAQLLQDAGAQDGGRIPASSIALEKTLSHLIDLADAKSWSREDSLRLLKQVLRLGAEGDCADYISAEQAVMAAELLMIETGLEAEHRQALDGLYRTLRDDDDYQPDRLREQMAALDARVGH